MHGMCIALPKRRSREQDPVYGKSQIAICIYTGTSCNDCDCSTIAGIRERPQGARASEVERRRGVASTSVLWGAASPEDVPRS